MMWALQQDILNNQFEEGSQIVTVHTGGLQGLQTVKDQLRFLI